jgi:SNF2 family DNA or RNA helicase
LLDTNGSAPWSSTRPRRSRTRDSQAAKAARLVDRAAPRWPSPARPIENRLEELWSIFEFLNPGMLGPLEAFSQQLKMKDEAWLDTLATTLRPFMLRRTKEQVLTELPEKTQQTLMVELEDQERTRYDELRDFYRAGLQKRFGEIGFERAKIHVLEALLRLRQAACHPGLLDPDRSEEGSAKIDMLMDQLETLAATGHKALVFSQFTTLLKLVETRLVARGIGHEYLDGATRDRQGGVQRFQTDESKKVFLISLKAGGAGLNLTASDYVFILDPWWNPAVEAQAIDRAHRMGQKRPVFAYRLIAKDTVEEKIMQLKDEKKRLADAIISGDRSLMKSLTEADILDLLG